MNRDKLLRFCTDRLIKLGLSDAKYKDRLMFEIGEIEDQNYYPFIEELLRKKIKNRPNINGLLSMFLLGVTNIDPIASEIKHKFYYEGSLPDIDCDFEIGARDKVYNYLSNKYGKYNTLFIGTQGKLGLKSAIKDVAKALDVPYMDVNTITTLIPDDMKTFDEVCSIKEVAEFFKIYPQVLEHSSRLLKSFRQYGVHAGGILVSDVDLRDHCAIVKSAKNYASGWEESGSSRELEYVGLIKFDVLGLSTLTQVKNCVRLINENYDLSLDKIEDHIDFSFEDEDVFKNIYWSGKLNNIFQFNDHLGKKWCKELKPSSIENLADINTLIRPGCLSAGVPDLYLSRKNGEGFTVSKIEADIVKDTYGLLLYQEQIMQLIVKATGGRVKLSEADIIRRKVEKKDDKVIQYLTDKISMNKKISDQERSDIVNQIILQGGYTFNKSHSIAYSYMSYLQAWIKYYYPLEFWCVALQQVVKKSDKLHTFIMSATNEGVEIESVNIFKSDVNFTIVDGKIYCGCTMAKGVGDKRVMPMIESRQKRPFTTLDDFLSRVKNKEFTIPKTLMLPLIKTGALSGFGHNVASLMDWYERFANKKARDIINIDTIDECDKRTLKGFEADVLGFNLKYDDFANLKTNLIKNGSKPISEVETMIANGEEISSIPFFGIITDIKSKHTKSGKKYKIVFITDNIAKVKITMWGNEYEKYANDIFKGNVIMTYLSNSEWGYNLQRRQYALFGVV